MSRETLAEALAEHLNVRAAQAEALREAAEALLTWPSTIDGSYRAAESCGEFANWLRDRADRIGGE